MGDGDKMINKLKNNPLLLFTFLAIGVSLIFASTVFKNRSQQNNIAILGKQKEISLKIPKAVNETVSIRTSPTFDFVYRVVDEKILIKPLSLLVYGEEYVVTAEYKDSSNGQTLLSSTVFLYEETEKVSELLGSLSVPSENFDLLMRNRHEFVAFVTVPDQNEQEILVKAKNILKSYEVDPESVDLSVEYSRSAREEGAEDPFSPVL